MVAKKLNMDVALAEVTSFLTQLKVSPGEEIQDLKSDFSFWREQEGSFVFSGSEVDSYLRCLERLVDTVGVDELLSPRAVDQALHNAIYAVLDIPGKRDADPADRVASAVKELREVLSAPALRYRVVVPVRGLSRSDLPTQVGKVEFAVFDEVQLAYYRDAISRHELADDEKQERLEQVEQWLKTDALGEQVVGITEVEARDWDAAELRALREIRLTLDVLNFFGDLFPFNYAHVTIPGDEERARLMITQLQDRAGSWGSYQCAYRHAGSSGEFSIAKLRAHDARKQIGFRRAGELLAKPSSKLNQRLVAALQWAGRATIDSRREEAFLLYAIALESFVLAEEDSRELTYRLRLRVAHLLGKSHESRIQLFDTVNTLYAIRSNIVHNGRYQVTYADLGRLRGLTKASLVHALTAPEFVAMKGTDDLREWFDRKILQGQVALADSSA